MKFPSPDAITVAAMAVLWGTCLSVGSAVVAAASLSTTTTDSAIQPSIRRRRTTSTLLIEVEAKVGHDAEHIKPPPQSKDDEPAEVDAELFVRLLSVDDNMSLSMSMSMPYQPSPEAMATNANANQLWAAEYPTLYNAVACECAAGCDLSAIGEDDDYSCRIRVLDLLVNRSYVEDDACTIVADQYPKVRSIRLPVVEDARTVVFHLYIYFYSTFFLNHHQTCLHYLYCRRRPYCWLSFVLQVCGGCSCESVLEISFPYTCSGSSNSSSSSSSDTPADTTTGDKNEEDCPCTQKVLTTDAGRYMCGDRMDYLIETQNKTELEACIEVGQKEFPVECGGCDPARNTNC